MQDLTRLALVGTANVPTDVAASAAVAALLPDASAAATTPINREQRLLWQAGSEALYRSAGRLPERLPLPPPAAPETWAELPAALRRWLSLSRLLELEAIAPWMVERLRAHRRRLPAELLPTVLAEPRTRAIWWPVLGERGRWLAAQHPDWQAALRKLANPDQALDDAAERQRIFDEASLPDRCAALTRQRHIDPALARQWLAAALPAEKAEPRLALVQTLTHQLSADDEPLLESLLADRSQAVRQAAAGLLARLPTSACAQRLAARADACLRWTAAAPTSGGLLGSVSRLLGSNAPQLTVEPPSAIDKSWERDGIAATPPAASYGGAIREGERAFWLRQVLALVPPARWSQQAQANPAQLLPLLQASEWADALLPGLAQAASHFADSDWASALLDLAYAHKNNAKDHCDVLWATLNAEARQRHVIAQLEADQLGRALQGLRAYTEPWPSALTQRVAEAASGAGWGLDKFMQLGNTSAAHEQWSLRIELLNLAALRAADADLPTLALALQRCHSATETALAAAQTQSGIVWHLRQAAKQTDLIQTHLRAKQQFIKELPL